jgi:hypothetical protein
VIAVAWAAALALSLGAGGASGTAARLAPSGLVYSGAPASVVQAQPAAGSCHALGSGVNQRPDRRCTPGAVNPAVTQATIDSTICKSGWTKTVRPPERVTDVEKRGSLAAYGEGPASRYEYDHFIPLELGGAVNDARNLWPERDYAHRRGFYLNPKDKLETALKRLVCSRKMTLATAQREMAANWVSAMARYAATSTSSSS